MGKTYWQAIVEADEPVPANRSVAERSLLLGSTDPRSARSPDVVTGATSRLLSPFVAPAHQRISRPSLKCGRLSGTSQSAKAIEQVSGFQAAGEILRHKGQADHPILSDHKRGWHRQLP